MQRVDEEIRALEALQRHIKEHQTIKFNVGGSIFVTSLGTLEKAVKRDPNCMFDDILSAKENPYYSWEKDCLFIDRDGTHFRQILNYLRDGDVVIPKDEQVRAEMLVEATFYKLDGLMSLLQNPNYKSPEETFKSNAFGDQQIIQSDEVLTSSKTLPQDLLCYMCKKLMVILTEPDDGQTLLCNPCKQLNKQKRETKVDLTNKVSLVTGGRIKIGYQVALKLLRCNAKVIVTTRFPVDAATRFKAESDSETWVHNLHIYSLDMRHLPSVQKFIDSVLKNYDRLDILINNAAQTVRKPPAYYKHLLQDEQRSDQHVDVIKSMEEIEDSTNQQDNNLSLSKLQVPAFSSSLSQLQVLSDDILEDDELFPPGKLDEYGQQVDMRTSNSWLQEIEGVNGLEMLEVQLINNIVPFLLVSQLAKLMTKPDEDVPKFVINVGSSEGQFNTFKSAAHPHTNMAKAALNMMTRTCSLEFARKNIYMNSVDTGWISKLNPHPLQEETRRIPLTVEDGASRILDPVFSGLQARPFFGHFLRNFKSASW